MVRALVSAVLAFALVASAAEPPRAIRLQRSSPQLPDLAAIRARTEAYRAVQRREQAASASSELSGQVGVLLEEAQAAAGQPPGTWDRLVSCVLPSEEQRKRSSAAHGKLEAARATVRQGLEESRIHFDALEARLRTAPNASGVLARLSAERTRLETHAEELERALSEVSGAMGCDTGSMWDRVPGIWQWSRGLGAVGDVESLRDRLASWGVGRPSGVLSADLTYVQGGLQPTPLPTESITPAYLAETPSDFELEDTTRDREVELSSEISNKAQVLGGAREAYGFVKNQLRLDWYYGSLKGATETLREGRGNDADLAALLVALLRAQGTPARFVEGTIELPIGKLADLLGLLGEEELQALYSPAPGGVPFELAAAKRDLALAALGAIGVPHEPVVFGGQVRAVRLSHIWVEAFLPVGDYRGAGAVRGGYQWIPLEPSIPGGPKYAATAPALDVLTAMGASAETLTQDYLHQWEKSDPLVFWQDKVTAFLNGHPSQLSFDQVLRKVEQRSEQLPLLSGSLPYRVVSVKAEHAFLPDTLKHRLHLTARDETGNFLELTLPMHQLVGRRTVFTYKPATNDDRDLIYSAGGLYNAPASVVELLATFRVDGVERAVATRPVGLGVRHRWTLEMLLPDGSTRRVENEIIAGNMVAISLGAPFDRYQEPEPKPAEDLDKAAATFLYARAASYVNAWTEAEEKLARLTQVVPVRPTANLVLVENQLQVTEVFGVPQLVQWKGLEVDADLRSLTPLELVKGRGAALLRLSGYQGSFLESKELFDATHAEAVSAVTLLQQAHKIGVPVLRIDPGNVATELGKVQAPPQVIADVSDLVARGREVLIPAQQLVIQDWTGTGFIAREPETEEGGYFLSGRLSGGQTVVSPGSWSDQELAEELARSDAPDAVDAEEEGTLISRIIKVKSSDLQKGRVGEPLPKELVVYVTTITGVPVKNAQVIFRTQDLSKPKFMSEGMTPDQAKESLTVETDKYGRARVQAFPDTKIKNLGIFQPGEPNEELHGFNVVTAEVMAGTQKIGLQEPFWFTAKPGPIATLKKTFPDETYDYLVPGVEIGRTLEVMATDEYDNALANQSVVWLSDDSKAEARFFVPQTEGVPHVQFLGSDPGQQVQLPMVTPTPGLVGVGFIPGTDAKTYTVTAQSGAVAQTFVIDASSASEFAFRVITTISASESGALEAPRPDPIIAELLRLQDGQWTRVKGNEPDVKAEVEVLTGDLSAGKAWTLKNVAPYQLGSGVTAHIDGDENIVEWPDYEVQNGFQTVRFRPSVYKKKDYGSPFEPVPLPTYYASFYSGQPTVSVSRQLAGGAAQALNSCGQRAPEDEALLVTLYNPADFPLYAQLVQHPEVEDVPVFEEPPPEVFRRDPEDVSRLLLVPNSATRFTLHLPPDSGSGDVEVKFYAPDFKLGSSARKLLGKSTYRFPVRKELGGMGSSTRELRASIVLAVRSFAAAWTPKNPDGTPKEPEAPVRVPSPIFRPAHLPLCITERGRLEVYSAEQLISGANVNLDKDGGLELTRLPGTTPLPDKVSANALSVLVPPGDPSGQNVEVKFFPAKEGAPLQSEVIPLITTVEDASALPVGHTFVKDVSTVDGHLVKQSVDLEVPGRGSGLQFVRSYTNRGHDASPLGGGWTHSYRGYVLPSWDANLNVARYMVVGGEGTGQVFECTPGPRNCLSQDGFHGTFRGDLAGEGAESHQVLVYRSKGGTEYRYGPAISTTQGPRHPLLSIRSPTGNEITFEYGGLAVDNEVGRIYTPGREHFLQLTYARGSGTPRAMLARVELYRNPDAPDFLKPESMKTAEHLSVCIAYWYNARSELALVQRYDGKCPESVEGQTPLRQESYTYVDSHLEELQNNLTSWTDANGRTTSFEYYQPGDALPGESEYLKFGNKAERVRYVKEPEAATTEFIYSLVPGDTLLFGTPTKAFVTEVKGPRPDVTKGTRYYMGLDGATARVERPLSSSLMASTSTTWDSLHMRRDAEEDARGRRTTFKYDGYGNLTERRISLARLPASGAGEATEPVKDDQGKDITEAVEKWSYDPAFSAPLCAMDAEGRITLTELDSNGVDPRTAADSTTEHVMGTGLLLSTRQYAQTVPLAARKSEMTCLELAAQLSQTPEDIVQHRSWCNVKGVSCPPGAARGDLLETWIEGKSASERINHTRIQEYDVWGLPALQVAVVDDSHELQTRFVRNKRGLLENQTDTFGHETWWEYDKLDRVKTLTRVNSKSAGGPLAEPSPSIVQTFTYYPGGQLENERTESTGFKRHYTLDGLNRVKEMRESGGGLSGELFTTYEYDKAGNRTHVTDRRGVTTITTYDWGDRPIQTSKRVFEGTSQYASQRGVNGSAGEVLTAEFGYDVAGNKVYEINLHRQRTDYALDSLYRVVRTRAPSVPGASFGASGPVRYESRVRYDLVGNPREKTDGNSHVTQLAYDFANRLVRTLDAEGREERRTYDHAGNLSVLENRTGTTVHLTRTTKYDGLNRPVSAEEKYRHPNASGSLEERERHIETRYTDAENTVTVKDARNFVTTTVKDDLDRVIRVVVDDGSGKLTRTPSENVGPALSLTTLRGYDGNGNLATEVDPLGRVTTHLFDGLNRRLETHRPMEATETFEYDGEGNVIGRVDVRDIHYRFTFDMFRRPVTDTLVESLSNLNQPLNVLTRTYSDEAAPDGVTFIEEKDARGNGPRRYLDALRREISVVDAKGKTQAARYDAVNARERRDRKGYRTFLRYDKVDRLIAQDDEDIVRGSPVVAYQQSIRYEDALQRETLTDRRGIPLVKQKDGLGRLVRTIRGTAPLQQTEETEYTARGEVVATIDANLHRKEWLYDGAGRKVEETLGAGTSDAAKTVYEYDKAGNLVAWKGPRATGVSYDERNSFDDLNRLVRRENALNHVWLTAYDKAGNKLCEKRPLGLPTLAHGALAGLSIEAIQAAACTGQYVTKYEYDELGKLTSLTDALDGQHTFVYDRARNLVAKQDARYSLTTYEYDALNLRKAEHQHLDAHPVVDVLNRDSVPGNEPGATPDGESGTLTWKWTYDANGNIETQTDPKGQVTTSTYGMLNRLVSRTFSGDAAREKPYIQSQSFEYDGNNNLVTVLEDKQTVAGFEDTTNTTSRYDNLDRLESQSRYYGSSYKYVTYGYDAKGNRKKVGDPNGVTTTYTYDALDRLKTATLAAGTTEYHYWPDGLLKGITHPNGVQEARCYDKAGQLSKQLTALGSIDGECLPGSAAKVLSRFEYEYDSNGNRRSLKESRTDPATQALGAVEQTEYGYDALDRLTGTRTPEGKAILYRLDPVGNRTGEREAPSADVTSLGPDAYAAVPASSLSRDVTYAFNRADWLRTSTDAKDATRNVTFGYDLNGNLVSKVKSGLNRRLAWDVRNTLTAVFDNDTEVGRYDYDANLQRESRKTASENVAYVLDEGFVLQELDAAQKSQPAKRRYHYAVGPLAVSDIAGSTNTRILHTNAQGSVTDVTSVTGAVSTTRKYDAWGSYRGGTTPSATDFKLGYTGHQYDPETGLTYARARYYDSDLGRFISRDSYEGTLADAPSLHRYVYARVNPLIYVDPTGHVGLSDSLGQECAAGRRASCEFLPGGSTTLGESAAAVHQDYLRAVNEYAGTFAEEGYPNTAALMSTAGEAGGMWVLGPVYLITQPDAVAHGIASIPQRAGEGYAGALDSSRNSDQRWRDFSKGLGATSEALLLASVISKTTAPHVGEAMSRMRPSRTVAESRSGSVNYGAMGENGELSQTFEALTQDPPPKRVLNLGSGDNPMKGATNVDIRPLPGVDVVADVNALPFAAGVFDEVHAINPYGFNPVSAEVARVMSPGGVLKVTGSPANKFAKPVALEVANEAGLKMIGSGPIDPAHQFGVPKNTSGAPLSKTSSAKTTTYTK